MKNPNYVIFFCVIFIRSKKDTMKNILAENMLRFGTKNISESSVRARLTEALLQAPSLSLNIPAQDAPNQNISFTLGSLGKNAANEYTGILIGITIGNVNVKKLTNQKLTGEYITGEIMSTDPNFNNLKSAIATIPANYIGTQADLPRNNVTLITKQDPNNPTAPKKNELALLGAIKKVQQTAAPK